jgi:hypothetical protein
MYAKWSRGEISEETRAAFQARMAREERPSSDSDRNATGKGCYLDAVVDKLLFSEGMQFRFTIDLDGRVWCKACVRTQQYPRHYLLSSHPPGTPFSVCVDGLLEKVAAFHEGYLKPSPDNWHG